MEPGAHVTSIEAMQRLRTALLSYEAAARDGVDSLTMQVRRAIEWLEIDRAHYWPEQVRRANEKLIETRNALERCQLRFGSEEAPSCYEQKQAVDAATLRLRFCESKLRLTKNWIRTVRQEVNAFDGQIAKMNNSLDGDLPKAVAELQRMIEALEKYTQAAPTKPRPEQGQGTSSTTPLGGPEP